MKINEIINETKRIDELAPLLAIPAWKAGAALAAKIAAKHGVGTLVKGGIKKGAVADKVRQWTSKAPPDSSTPDALKKAKVGYGTGEVDPPLATAAKKKYAVPPEQVARPKSTKKFGSPVGPMSNLERKRQRP